MGFLSCCSAAPVTKDEEPCTKIVRAAGENGHPNALEAAAKVQATGNAKVVEALARADLSADTRVHNSAVSAAPPAAIDDTAEAPCSAGTPTTYPKDGNVRMQALVRGMDPSEYLEIIDCNPVSPERLNVPLNAFTRCTAQGKPYPIELGPPLPAVNDERLATLLSMAQVNTPPDPKIDAILDLACQVLGIHTIMVSLLDGEKKFIKCGTGLVAGGGISLDPPAICHWSLVPTLHQMAIVEDTHQDARTRFNSTVVNPPYVRFYCGAPLVATNGHRLGMLCIVDQEPRKFDEERAAILCNLAELVVRELEATWAAQYQRRHSLKLIRAMSCYHQAFMVVDTSIPGWRILHANESLTEQTGITKEVALQKSFWDLFGVDGSQDQEPWTAFEHAMSEQKPFTIKNAICDVSGLSEKKLYNIMFRPANTDAIDDSAQLVGVPAGTCTAQPAQAASRYYFVTVRPGSAAVAASAARPRLPFEGLRLGAQLGKGSYGRVYRGTWQGKRVAVKVVDDASNVQMREGMPMEAALTEGLTHTSICRLYAHALRSHSRTSSDEWQRDNKGGADSDELWLLMEYCDKGSVQEAVDKGWFRTKPTIEAPPNMPVILATAAEIANAMAFLHAKGVMHGDLTGGNVLLCSVTDNRHKFCAKVADFGLARDLGVVSRVETRTYGTLTHMAPEVLSCDIVSKGADVYSFGVMLWEMYCGERAWAGLNTAQVIHAVAINNQSLKAPAGTPSGYADLMIACMARDPEARPNFQVITETVAQLRAELDAGSADSTTERTASCASDF
ncbi:probable mitogen-activated protein kinase kinase kinase 11 at C-terminar half [Coccomyxa sp. Obi]|nr:probable mitogen-activated protein kinase kinase kinase 11 at C-terminar half [Coccomyxa sp. Obi]